MYVLSMYVCVCVCICMYVCVYIYIYIYIYTGCFTTLGHNCNLEVYKYGLQFTVMLQTTVLSAVVFDLRSLLVDALPYGDCLSRVNCH